jgi:hypothetical protein
MKQLHSPPPPPDKSLKKKRLKIIHKNKLNNDTYGDAQNLNDKKNKNELFNYI